VGLWVRLGGIRDMEKKFLGAFCLHEEARGGDWEKKA